VCVRGDENLSAVVLLAHNFKQDLIIYIYIYIYVCVCVCVLFRVFQNASLLIGGVITVSNTTMYI